MTRGHLSEGKRWVEEVLRRGGKQKRRVRALRGLAILLMEQGELARAEELADEALALQSRPGANTRRRVLPGCSQMWRRIATTWIPRVRATSRRPIRRAVPATIARRRLTSTTSAMSRASRVISTGRTHLEQTHALFIELDDRVGQGQRCWVLPRRLSYEATSH